MRAYDAAVDFTRANACPRKTHVDFPVRTPTRVNAITYQEIIRDHSEAFAIRDTGVDTREVRTTLQNDGVTPDECAKSDYKFYRASVKYLLQSNDLKFVLTIASNISVDCAD